MRRGLDLAPDWDNPHTRGEFNLWYGVCKQYLTYWQGIEMHVISPSSRGKHQQFKDKERLAAALDIALKLYVDQLVPMNNAPILLDPEQRIFASSICS